MDPLHERQELALNRQIQDAARWPPYSKGGALPTAFFLLGSPEPTPRPGLWAPQAAVAREGEPQPERMCGISCDPGCCTLLLYSRIRLFEFGF